MGGLETSELDSFEGTLKPRWGCKGDLASKQGIVMSEEVSIAPLLGHSHISSGKLYTLSTENDVAFFRAAVSNLLFNKSWPSFFATKEQKRSCNDVLALNKELRERLLDSNSDAVDGGKRKAQDIIFTGLGYDCL